MDSPLDSSPKNGSSILRPARIKCIRSWKRMARRGVSSRIPNSLLPWIQFQSTREPANHEPDPNPDLWVGEGGNLTEGGERGSKEPTHQFPAQTAAGVSRN
ncbi:hypothetical protein NL676_002043 [Syzygium grande]|nr:hypothetical protein NL676_002043 [Syzygium grande]